jgi:serine/threonine protein kinase
MKQNRSMDFRGQPAPNDTQSLLGRLRALGRQEVPDTLLPALRVRLAQEKKASGKVGVQGTDFAQISALPTEVRAESRRSAATRGKQATVVLEPQLVREESADEQFGDAGGVEQSNESHPAFRDEELFGSEESLSHPSPGHLERRQGHTSPAIGNSFGNYQIVALLSSGAFGSVYLARHVFLDRMAAVKVLHRVHMNNHAVEDFRREARMLEILQHPHILRILEFGVDGGLPYLIMEYAPDGSLRDLLQRQEHHPLPVKKAIEILTQVGSALTYVHQHGLVHRDIKPENILLKGNHFLLGDFGIALLESGISQSPADRAGTPAYMAPECFQGLVSYASDQYSLGCVAYELLTGRRPVTGSHLEEMWYQHTHIEPVALRELNPAVPRSIERAVLKALAKSRTDRHGSVQAFINEISRGLPKDGDTPSYGD